MLSLVSLNANDIGNAEAPYEMLKERLGLFRLKSDSPKQDMSLWKVLTSGNDDVGGANLYKAKNPKKYIQVKT